MTPTAEEILIKLVSMFPSFKGHWNHEVEDWRRADGSFTLHGLFSEFSYFVRDRFSQMSEQKQKELMGFIESCVEADDDNELDNAACTCFLENLASEPPLSQQLRKYMGPKSLKFFNAWDFPQGDQQTG